MTTPKTLTDTVCVQRRFRASRGKSAANENRTTTADMSHTKQTKVRSKRRTTTTVCIQYNYIQQQHGEINRVCIQNDYIAEVAA